MMKSLSLLAVLVFSAICMPAPAHADTCTLSALRSAATNFFQNYIGIANYSQTSYGSISGSNCGTNGYLSEEVAYNHPGEPAFWEAFYGTHCSTPTASPRALETQIYWKPTTWQFYGQFRCLCNIPNGAIGCGWF